ncbi:MAG: M23 family metallopeptidase [Candidatus Heimdallarchaeota archaeon]|nr:M23 family metallopeptidase [Candidatus Heimdallarchaeota archaeon]
MRKFTVTLIIILLLAGGLGGVYIYFQWDNLFFTNDNRYDASELNYMNVVYDNRSDIYAFNEGYSSSDNCPWGFKHEGIDYFLLNNSKVIAAAPGQVEEIEWTDNGEGVENRFYARIWIRFNKDIRIGYNFEPWTQNVEDKDQLLSMFSVQVGDWIEIGEEIARFLYVGNGAHIHFDVIENNERSCVQNYFSEEGYTEIMEMIHSFHHDWELCYP